MPDFCAVKRRIMIWFSATFQSGSRASSLPDNRVVVGDRLGQDAAYFPAAFGIQIYARPSESVGELFDAIEMVSPELAGPTAAALWSVDPGEPEAVLASLGAQIPELTERRVIAVYRHQAPSPPYKEKEYQ